MCLPETGLLIARTDLGDKSHQCLVRAFSVMLFRPSTVTCPQGSEAHGFPYPAMQIVGQKSLENLSFSLLKDSHCNLIRGHKTSGQRRQIKWRIGAAFPICNQGGL